MYLRVKAKGGSNCSWVKAFARILMNKHLLLLASNAYPRKQLLPNGVTVTIAHIRHRIGYLISANAMRLSIVFCVALKLTDLQDTCRKLKYSKLLTTEAIKTDQRLDEGERWDTVVYKKLITKIIASFNRFSCLLYKSLSNHSYIFLNLMLQGIKWAIYPCIDILDYFFLNDHHFAVVRKLVRLYDS